MKRVDESIAKNVSENLQKLAGMKSIVGLIADEADCGPQYAADIVSGKIPPTLPVLLAVAKLFRVSLDDLCYGSIERPGSKIYMTERQKEIIDLLDAPGATVTKVADQLGVTRSYIYKCIDASGERWRLRKYAKKTEG